MKLFLMRSGLPKDLPHRENDGSDQEQQDRKGAEGSDVRGGDVTLRLKLKDHLMRTRRNDHRT